jgi:SAM-dependent methyltransferase
LFTLFTSLGFKLWSFFDFLRTARLFYSDPLFRKVDLALLWSYLGDNPYRASRRFLEKKGEENIYAYGETPLASLQQIARVCHLTSQDTIYELGCGRGRTCFWLGLILKAQVVGIDYVPAFISKAKRVAQKYGLKNPEFRCEDFLKTDLKGCTVVYLNGTCLSDQDIVQLIQKLNRLPKGTKAITVSFPLRDYAGGEPWKMIKSISLPFTWDSAEVYLQELV